MSTMNLQSLVDRYYDTHREYLDLQLTNSHRTVEDYLLNELYACLEESIPIEQTVVYLYGSNLNTAEETKVLFLQLKEKLGH